MYTLKHCEPLLYLCILLKILSASTASAERNFSSQEMVGQERERLNGLARIHAHRDTYIDIEKIINVPAKSPRRLDFIL